MAAAPSQKETLELTLAEIQAQTILIQTQTTEIQAQTVAILAMSVDIAAQAADIALSAAELTKAKNYHRWQNEYLAGVNPELAAIEAGTHIF